MPEKDYSNALIQTKLHRPPLPQDLVARPRLTGLLNSPTLPPLILISAPAGYGKSTLAKCLVATLDFPTAWLSLDEQDNDLGEFLQYFLAAVQTIFPDEMPETQAMLLSARLPPLPAIAKNLVNELDKLEKPFLLVFDDYHAIESQPIHDLLNEILLHPPRPFHLVLCTRMDPPLALITMRASGQVIEFRTQDLRFNLDETQRLFGIMLGENLDQKAINEVDTQAEGWVTGLRLTALAMRHRIGRDSIEGELSLQNRYVTEYLISEILTKQAATLSDCMLRTSILKRFNADLCEAVCFPGLEQVQDKHRSANVNGTQFTEWLSKSNLFVIPLDNQHKWFRYHHLFQEFLQQELYRRMNQQEIAKLHIAAGSWFARNNLIEEALYHYLAIGDHVPAIQLIARSRLRLMNATQWPRLERWLRLFPDEAIDRSAELWMLKTWLVYHDGQFSELPALIQQLAVILENDPLQADENTLEGEISSLRSLIAYHRGDAEQAVFHAQRALKLLPAELWIVRILARTYLGGAYLLQGEEHKAYHTFYDGFEKEQVKDKSFKATLLMTACNFHWLTADLKNMSQAAKQCIALSQETGQEQILGFGNYQLGRVRYQQNNLSSAEELFTSVVSRPYLNYGIAHTNSACGLALTYQALGKETIAQQVAEEAVAFILETGNTSQLPLIHALQADLALMQGRIFQAKQWVEKLDPHLPLSPMPWFLAPHLSLVKVWLAENTPGSLDKAAEFLSHLHKYLTSTHNNRFLIETLALQAILMEIRGDRSGALVVLENALKLAQPGSFIRLFVDLGPQLGSLLTRMEPDNTLQSYLNQIKTASPGTSQMGVSISQKKMIEPLTNREMEILALLAERKTNKEIAMQLTITTGTVRQHSHNLYQKLEVSNRREAVSRAFDLGLLT